jgi:hypothetical protein
MKFGIFIKASFPRKPADPPLMTILPGAAQHRLTPARTFRRPDPASGRRAGAVYRCSRMRSV